MSTQPARGMRDFLPEEVRRRDYVVGIIRGVYDRYGFEPLETPAAENIETLLGKYGDEGNKLIFKILMRGEHEASGQADLALRYDLTVPLARVVAEYQSKLPKFFKRYQIQPVWRADRPARGRFREFYQCDIDAIGSKSLTVEVELLAAADEVLRSLGFTDFTIRLNHRDILTGLLDKSGLPREKHGSALISIDKRDKADRDVIMAELVALAGGAAHGAAILAAFTREASHDNDLVLRRLEDGLASHENGRAAVSQLNEILEYASGLGFSKRVVIDPGLARGLTYYTGPIMEVNVPDLAGSLGGGGRYDNLIGTFLGQDVPACGFSLGLERILVVMQERRMFPPEVEQGSVDIVVAALDEGALASAMETAAELRRTSTLRVDLYPDVAKKMDKVFKHVDQRKAKFIAILGSDEVASGTVTVRNVALRTKETMPRAQAASFIQRALSD